MIGDIPMPAGFRYREILLKGKPKHDKTDAFRIRHPSMDVGRRAKIFAPFDALRGFNEAVASKDVLYEHKRELNEEDQAELNRRLTQEEYERYSLLSYANDAMVGKDGVEYAFEEYLHGHDGKVNEIQNNAGTILSTVYLEEPEPGAHIYLTIDKVLQEREEENDAQHSGCGEKGNSNSRGSDYCGHSCNGMRYSGICKV